jgi:hypothetical protein
MTSPAREPLTPIVELVGQWFDAPSAASQSERLTAALAYAARG